jgi:hypothetical protein
MGCRRVALSSFLTRKFARARMTQGGASVAELPTLFPAWQGFAQFHARVS